MPLTPPLPCLKPRTRKEEIWGRDTMSGKNNTIETNLAPTGNKMPREIKSKSYACTLVWRYVCMYASLHAFINLGIFAGLFMGKKTVIL